MSQGALFDIIFVGGGTACCIAAGRLASANPGLKILILEAGPHSLNVESIENPSLFLSNLYDPVKNEKYIATHIGQPTEAVANRKIPVNMGKVVGGGSSVNFMIYSRASASDYDDWETIHKNPGWGSKDLIPLLKEIETYGPEIVNSNHGKEGPLGVSFPKDHTELSKQFLEAAKAYDKERSIAEDWNDFKTSNAYGHSFKYINEKTGRRSDVAYHFIYNQPENKNLVVLPESRVIRVLFEGTKAVGVEYVGQPDQAPPSTALASKLVVISAGAFGSPPILERSGIGSEEILRKNDIHQLVDLPGVGNNYEDHQLTIYQYKASKESETYDHVLRASPAELRAEGRLSYNYFDAGYKLRPSPDEVQNMGPEFEQRWNENFAPNPDKAVVIGAFAPFYLGPQSTVDSQSKYFGLAPYLAYPLSSGSVHNVHGLDPFGPVDFRHGYLESEADMAAHRWAYKHTRELARRMPFYRGELPHTHPAFPTGSDATTKSENLPVDFDAPKIVYTAKDNDAIDEHIRRNTTTGWHSIGTCPMKPREEGGVVDSRLNVYGTTQLKVADLSICPRNVGANTNNTALAVGAKAAVLIAEDLGLKL